MKYRNVCILFLAGCFLIAASCSTAENTISIFPEDEVLLKAQYPVPEYVERLLEVAIGELGEGEDRGGNTKYGTWTGVPDAEWCAEYLCWCVDQTDQRYGTDLLQKVYPFYTASNVGRNWFIRNGRYIARNGMVPEWGSQWFLGSGQRMEKNSYTPQPGDWMFFSTYANGDTTHVAMVEFCTQKADGTVIVHVIEGNNPDRVARNAYSIDNWAIQGYGTVHELAGITMRSGNQGEKVRQLQEKLALLGYLDPQYVTGVYASITAQSVQNFQRMNGLKESGIANQDTQMKIESKMNEYYENHPEIWAVTD